MQRSAVLVAVLVVGVLFPVLQEGAWVAAQEASEQAVLDAEEMGVSLARIRNKLERLPDSLEERSLLRLNFYIEVYAQAPQLDYFFDYDIHNSPIPSGPPMYYEMLSVMRSDQPNILPPPVNLTPILGWVWK